MVLLCKAAMATATYTYIEARMHEYSRAVTAVTQLGLQWTDFTRSHVQQRVSITWIMATTRRLDVLLVFTLFTVINFLITVDAQGL